MFYFRYSVKVIDFLNVKNIVSYSPNNTFHSMFQLKPTATTIMYVYSKLKLRSKPILALIIPKIRHKFDVELNDQVHNHNNIPCCKHWSGVENHVLSL